MHEKHLIFCLLSHLALAGPAYSESAPSVGFETIYDLPFVHSLEFSSQGEELFVAVSGHLLQWELEPLKLVSHQKTQILANDMMLGPDQRLYAVGIGWEPSRISHSGSKAVAYGRGTTSGEAFQFEGDYSNTGISQYSSVAFDSAGTPIVVSASNYSASPFAKAEDLKNLQKKEYPQLKFRCGGSTQLSIVAIDGVDHFVSSTAGAAVLEFGKLTLGSERSTLSDCFEVEQIRKGQPRLPTYDPVRHAVIRLEDGSFTKDGASHAAVVLDPNTNKLHLFGIEPFSETHFLSRLGSLELELSDYLPVRDRKAVLTELATDATGREIHIGSNTSNVVLRFTFDGNELRSRGRFDLGAPVQRLKMSADGSVAGIVTGREPFGGDWRIVLIMHPAALQDWLQVPASFPSIRNLQEELNDNGLTAGFPDGILGPQTTTAIDNFVNQDGGPNLIPNELRTAIATSFPGYLLDQGGLGLNID